MVPELSWLRSELSDRRLSVISKATGLHPNTIARIRNGENTNPKLETLNRLAGYLNAQERQK